MAVVGAATTFGKWGFDLFRSAKTSRVARTVYPVNRHATEVQGIRAYPSLKALPEPIDFVVIVIPTDGVLETVREAVEIGAKAALIITAGLAETGTQGATLQAEIVKTARDGGLRLVGPNCMGNFNTGVDFSILRQNLPISRGHVGVISQSGGFASHILHCGTDQGVGFSKFISIGNEADLHFEDFLEYLGQDDETKVITGYIEGLRDGKRFFKLAREITKRKPVVVVKVGRTAAGSRAARSHTSAIAGSDVTYETAFRQAGVIRVNDVEELFDVASALLRLPLPSGNRVGILTAGGGFACVSSDACESQGLKIATISPQTVERLNAILPPRWPHANPVDTVAAGFVTYPCLWPLIEDENLDALLVVDAIGYSVNLHRWAGNAPPDVREVADRSFQKQEQEELTGLDKLFGHMDRFRKPVVISNNLTEDMKASAIFEKLRESGVLMYPTPERAARVLTHLLRYSRYLGFAR